MLVLFAARQSVSGTEQDFLRLLILSLVSMEKGEGEFALGEPTLEGLVSIIGEIQQRRATASASATSATPSGTVEAEPGCKSPTLPSAASEVGE